MIRQYILSMLSWCAYYVTKILCILHKFLKSSGFYPKSKALYIAIQTPVLSPENNKKTLSWSPGWYHPSIKDPGVMWTISFRKPTWGVPYGS